MKMNQKKLKEIINDSERLGPGSKLGASRKMSKEETKQLYKKAGLQMISLRLPNEVIEKLKDLAEAEGIKYQPFIRKLLIEFAMEERRSLEERVAQLESKVANFSTSKAS